MGGVIDGTGGRISHKNEEASAFKLSSEESNQRYWIFVDTRSLILYILSHLAPVGFPNIYRMDSDLSESLFQALR